MFSPNDSTQSRRGMSVNGPKLPADKISKAASSAALLLNYIFPLHYYEVFFVLYVLSFACAKERTKEKHTGNDIQPLPDALIKLLCYC